MAGDEGAGEVREFGRVRQLLWPIRSGELKTFLPMLLMFFFISLVYSLLRNTKDSLIVTAPGAGADLIPFLKVYGVIPGSIVTMLIYAQLSNHLSRRRLFQATLAPFLLFFFSFAFLFPIRQALEPHWPSALPPAIASLAAMARHWLLCLFYVMAELWGSVALSLLFWSFANDIVRMEQARRFYALFGIGANLALMAVKPANQFIHAQEQLLIRHRPMAPWTAYVILLMAVVVASIAAILLIHRWIHQQVMKRPDLPPEARPNAQALPRLNLREAFRFLALSAHLRCIAIMVLGYGVAINLIEVTWKTQLGLLHPQPKDYQDFMANFSLATGATTLFLILFVANNVIRARGWTFAALATPVVLLVTGIGFFTFILLEDASATLLAGLGSTPLAAAVLFGTCQNVLSKATKYSLFDPTKEMAYIPLDAESKSKGKAAIDVVGARLGKAGGSLIQQGLIALHHSLRAVPGQIALILLLVIGAWIWAARQLGRRLTRLGR